MTDALSTDDIATIIARAKVQVEAMVQDGELAIGKIAELRTTANEYIETAESEGGLVKVTVNASGIPIAIEISSDASDKLADRLGATVLDVAQSAARAVRERVQATMAEIRSTSAATTERLGAVDFVPDSVRQIIEAAEEDPSMDPPDAASRHASRADDEAIDQDGPSESSSRGSSRLAGGW